MDTKKRLQLGEILISIPLISGCIQTTQTGPAFPFFINNLIEKPETPPILPALPLNNPAGIVPQATHTLALYDTCTRPPRAHTTNTCTITINHHYTMPPRSCTTGQTAGINSSALTTKEKEDDLLNHQYHSQLYNQLKCHIETEHLRPLPVQLFEGFSINQFKFNTILVLLVLLNDEKAVQKWLATPRGKQDLNLPDNTEYTPLHYAALNRRLSIAQFLLEAGADIQATGKLEYSVLHYWAIQEGADKEIFELLVSYNVNINAKNTSHCTPLHLTVQKGNKDKTILLLAQNAEINALNNTRTTPLHYAISSRNTEIVSILLEAEADPNLLDSHGSAPLHYAVLDGQEEAVKLLLLKGADPNLQERTGKTALYLALLKKNLNIKKYINIVELLLTYGARLDLLNVSENFSISKTGYNRFCKILAQTSFSTNDYWLNTLNPLKNTLKKYIQQKPPRKSPYPAPLRKGAEYTVRRMYNNPLDP